MKEVYLLINSLSVLIVTFFSVLGVIFTALGVFATFLSLKERREEYELKQSISIKAQLKDYSSFKAEFEDKEKGNEFFEKMAQGLYNACQTQSITKEKPVEKKEYSDHLYVPCNRVPEWQPEDFSGWQYSCPVIPIILSAFLAFCVWLIFSLFIGDKAVSIAAFLFIALVLISTLGPSGLYKDKDSFESWLIVGFFGFRRNLQTRIRFVELFDNSVDCTFLVSSNSKLFPMYVTKRFVVSNTTEAANRVVSLWLFSGGEDFKRRSKFFPKSRHEEAGYFISQELTFGWLRILFVVYRRTSSFVKNLNSYWKRITSA